MKKNYTEEEALEVAFEKLKPSLLGFKIYNKYREYYRRYKRGELNKKAKETLLSYFGFTSDCVYTYDPDKDQSLNKE